MKKRTQPERAYRVTHVSDVYATSFRAAALKAQHGLRRGETHAVFEVTDLNTQKTMTRDVSPK